MCIHCTKKQLNAVECLLDTIAGRDLSMRIAQESTAKRFDINYPQTPYQDYKKLIKRINRNRIDIKKVFNNWRKRFNEALTDERGGRFAFMRLRKQEEFPIEVWEAILLNVVNAKELEEVLVNMVDEEVLITAAEVTENLFKVNGIVTTGPPIPPTEAMEFLHQYEFRLSASTASQTDERLKNIIMNGMAEGKSVPKIAKDINNTFTTLSRQKATVIARTETIRASAVGSLTAYENAGIDQVALLPAVDACPICMGIAAGNPYKTTGKGKNLIPVHPNCKCALVPVFDETDVEAINTGVVNPSTFG
jgi:SPP1 gp7 family putative phage head morphogenesis protein